MGKRLFAGIVFFLFLWVAYPLFSPVVLGAMCATLVYPWVDALEQKKLPRFIASALVTGLLTLFFLLPTSVVLVMGSREAFQQLQRSRTVDVVPSMAQAANETWVQAAMQSPRVQSFFEKFTYFVPVHLDELTRTAEEAVKSGAAKLAESLGSFLAFLPGLMMAAAILVVSVYFFLLDGNRLVSFLKRNRIFLPMQTDRLFETLHGACKSVLLASLVAGAIQSVIEAIVCWSVGVPNAGMIGVLVFLTSFIPVMGALPVTLGVALYQYIFDHPVSAAILLVSAVVLSILDNLVRPLFMRGSANLHPLLAFVAAFGGLQMLGFIGIFLGPIIAAVTIVMLDILFRESEA
jgi:predicted PurR-regulated permease PerM